MLPFTRRRVDHAAAVAADVVGQRLDAQMPRGSRHFKQVVGPLLDFRCMAAAQAAAVQPRQAEFFPQPRPNLVIARRTPAGRRARRRDRKEVVKQKRGQLLQLDPRLCRHCRDQ